MKIRNVPLTVISDLAPPFDVFKYGFVMARRNLNGRRYIKFKGKKRGRSYGIRLPRGMTYARYVYQCKYWREHGKLIPRGQEVDHINDRRTDDRLANLQLLSSSEHRWKRDIEKYEGVRVSTKFIKAITQYLHLGYSWSQIIAKTGLKPDHLRYILVHKIKGYNFELNAEMNLVDIRRMVKLGISPKEIGDHFGVSATTMRRIISNELK